MRSVSIADHSIDFAEQMREQSVLARLLSIERARSPNAGIGSGRDMGGTRFVPPMSSNVPIHDQRQLLSRRPTVLRGTPSATVAGDRVGEPDLPLLADWLRDRLTDPQLNDLPIGRSPAAAAERRQALDALDVLATDGHAGLCHGDTSGWNILIGESNSLWPVDPRGLRGDVIYDLAVIALKAARCGTSNDRGFPPSATGGR
jgi:streptomycin 6-kinase